MNPINPWGSAPRDWLWLILVALVTTWLLIAVNKTNSVRKERTRTYMMMALCVATSIGVIAYAFWGR